MVRTGRLKVQMQKKKLQENINKYVSNLWYEDYFSHKIKEITGEFFKSVIWQKF